MDGVHPPRPCGMAVVRAAAVLPSAVLWLMPYSPHCSAGEYCCHVVHYSLPGAWCVGGEYVSVLFVWWGVLRPPSPSSWWRVGPLRMVGGMASEGRWCYWPPRSCVAPPLVCVVVPLNGGSGVLCGVPVFGWVHPPRIVLFPLALSCPSCVAPPSIVMFSVTALSV